MIAATHLLDRHVPDVRRRSAPRGAVEAWGSARAALGWLLVRLGAGLVIRQRVPLCRCTGSPSSHVRVVARPYDWAAESAAGTVSRRRVPTRPSSATPASPMGSRGSHP